MANLRPNLDTALYSVLNVASLTNLATGGVYNLLAPQDTRPPYVVYQAMSKVDDYWAYTQRGAQAVYMVKAISRSALSVKEATDIDTQVDTLLQDATLTITGFGPIYCRRESDFYLSEDLNGDTYQHVGGLYRIIADQS
jgi:hypothetical protein